ncbi:MAG: response regulator [Acidimicrobiia bacterium]|nr:response regulator [Acidimicrobiia bacterium]
MAPRILVIEDEPDVRATLRMLLEDEGYEVNEAGDAEAGLASFDQQEPNLILVDLKLPGRSGFEVARSVRYQGSTIPIIVVTAQVDSHDVVAGLEAGADDYVTKPYVPKELAARIRAALRRADRDVPSTPPRRRLEFGDLAVSPDEGLVWLRGEEITLTRTEFKLLCEVAQHPGIVLSRDQLLQRVWGYDYLGDSRLVDAHVRRLRTKIEDDPANPRYVLTVRGLGYRFTG